MNAKLAKIKQQPKKVRTVPSGRPVGDQPSMANWRPSPGGFNYPQPKHK